jgi:hypothetical protein
MPSRSPITSTMPSGSNWRCSATSVRLPASGWNVTRPRFVAPLVFSHVIVRSGSCSTMRASHSRATPAIDAFQRSRTSSICWTDSTPRMNRGNSSNWVHWLYTVLTGPSTSMRSSTVVMVLLLDGSGRVAARREGSRSAAA